MSLTLNYWINLSYTNVITRLFAILKEFNLIRFQDCILIHPLPPIIDTASADECLQLDVGIEIRKGETKAHFYSPINNERKFAEWIVFENIN